LWYVSVPFEVVRVTDQAEEDEDTHEAPPRQRPLLAVDFGRAVWLEHVCAADEEEDDEPYERGQKRLRFVSFPGMRLEGEGHAVRSGIGGVAVVVDRMDRSRWKVQLGRWRFRKSWTCTKWRRSTSTRARVR
jgi:hypothetical protein